MHILRQTFTSALFLFGFFCIWGGFNLAYSRQALDQEVWAPKLEIDPNLNLSDLKATETQMSVVTGENFSEKTYWADTSALIQGVSIKDLYLSSIDFNRYSQMGMPGLKDCQVIQSETTPWIIWNDMETWLFGIKIQNRHFMEVSISNSWSQADDVTILGKGYTTWNLVAPKPEWKNHELVYPQFYKFAGSWYLQDLGQDGVYARYYLVGIPKINVGFVVKKMFEAQVPNVIRALQKDAKNRSH